MSPSDRKIYAGFDPGLTTGLAVAISENGNPAEIKGYVNIQFKNMEDSLLNWDMYWEQKPEAIIVEDYRLNPHTHAKHERIQSKLETVQVIGMLKMWAKSHDIRFVEQPRDRKKVGYMNWGKSPKPKSNPMNHAYDAAAHLVYWLVRHKLMEVKL